MDSIKLLSPGKINLFLKVLGKRSDGYHNLASLFQTIDLFDELHLSLSGKDELTCTDSSLPTGSKNLIIQAIELFREKTGIHFFATVHLKKNIPVFAGLGGGSSNAATTLWGINKLLGSPVPLHRLQRWSGEIGSDIPFFFSTGAAYCTGRGGHVMSLPPLKKSSLTLVQPEIGLSTVDVYRKVDPNELLPRDPEMTLRAFYEGKGEYFNDLETAAFSICPTLKDLKEELNSEECVAQMTGSGDAFFCMGKKPNTSLRTTSAQFCYRKNGSWYGG